MAEASDVVTVSEIILFYFFTVAFRNELEINAFIPHVIQWLRNSETIFLLELT